MTRLDEQLDIAARARMLLPQSRAPYSAHVKLRYADGREADMLMGGIFRRGEGLTILDWRTAPLAEVFFAAWAPGSTSVHVSMAATIISMGTAYTDFE